MSGLAIQCFISSLWADKEILTPVRKNSVESLAKLPSSPLKVFSGTTKCFWLLANKVCGASENANIGWREFSPLLQDIRDLDAGASVSSAAQLFAGVSCDLVQWICPCAYLAVCHFERLGCTIRERKPISFSSLKQQHLQTNPKPPTKKRLATGKNGFLKKYHGLRLVVLQRRISDLFLSTP